MTAFLDTNILVYAFSTDPRAGTASALLDPINRIGVQSLNEFALVARRRMGMDWGAVHAAIDRLLWLFPTPEPLTLAIHDVGLRVAERHGFRIYDAMIVAAALAAGCDTLWSEDMHHGLVVDDRLTIRNPFA